MAATASRHAENGDIGPHPSFIEVAKPFIFEQRVQGCMNVIGMTEAKEDAIRLQGVAWIDSVRRSLQLPVRTYNTACVYFHKFRLVHSDREYGVHDAAAAALFTACKIEDTLKKSKEILCASYNHKLPASEQLSPDDPVFDNHSKTIIGLERLMLEAAGFDFRNRYPQKLLMKIAKLCEFNDETVARTAYKMCLDLYRTFAPLKQTASTMALACVELAARLHGSLVDRDLSEKGIDYQKWHTTRAEVMETILDLLDLYTHHRPSTLLGPEYPLDAFISIRIPVNQEASASSLPRFTNWQSPKKSSFSSSLSTSHNVASSNNLSANAKSQPNHSSSSITSSLSSANKNNNISPNPNKVNGIRSSETRNNRNKPNSAASTNSNSQPAETTTATTAPRSSSSLSNLPRESPHTPTSPGPTGARGQTGTVRFMLDPAQAREEKTVVDAYFKVEEEEVEVEVEVGNASSAAGSGGSGGSGGAGGSGTGSGGNEVANRSGNATGNVSGSGRYGRKTR